MQRSRDRILTTWAGSLIRLPEVLALEPDAAGTFPIWHPVRRRDRHADEHGTQTSVRGNSA
jgi:hypothetical protein